LFQPGAPGAGIQARAYFVGASLRIETETGTHTVPGARIELKTGGFDGRTWSLAWPTPAGLASLVFADVESARALCAGAPAELARRFDALARTDRRRERRFRFGLALVGLLFIAPVLLLGLFWLNGERVADWAARRVSLEQEQRLGDLAFGQMRAGLKMRADGPALELTRTLGMRLTAGSRYRYQWFVAESSEINAFALPGGYVVVHAGLIKAAENADELAGVLAHEIQHVELRHSLKNMIHGLGWRAMLALALGDLSGGLLGDLANQLGALSYSRELEQAADLGALRTLRRAGIAPDGLLSFFDKLARKETPSMTLLASHPATGDRIERLRQAIADQGVYPTTGPTYDWTRARAGL
jgi:Zn-dependent protease with chaperone function